MFYMNVMLWWNMLLHTVGPVSYTHLDVYKRQLQHEYLIVTNYKGCILLQLDAVIFNLLLAKFNLVTYNVPFT